MRTLLDVSLWFLRLVALMLLTFAVLCAAILAWVWLSLRGDR